MGRHPDQVSDEARQVMARGFAAGWTAKRVAQAVADATGEAVTERTVSRRAQDWRAEVARRKLARERMEDLVSAAKAGGLSAAEMIQALAMDSLIRDPEGFTGSDPVRVQRLALQGQALRVRERAVEMQGRKVDLDERRMALLEARETRAVAAAEELEAKAARGEQISADDVRRIREIYGLKTGDEANGNAAN